VKQAESLLYDPEFKQTITSNAKQYVDSAYNEKVEFHGYSSVVREMCRTNRLTKSKEVYI